MLTITELKKDRATKLDQAKAIESAAKAMGREVSDEEFSKIEALVAESNELTKQIGAIEEKTQKRAGVLAALDKAHTALDQFGPAKAGAAAAAQQVSVKARWESDPKKGFERERDFYSAVMSAGLSGRVDERLESLRAKPEHVRLFATAGSDEQSTFSDPYGGFLLPEGHSPNLLTRAAPGDPFAGRTANVPMDTLTVNIDARTDHDHSTSVSGGLQVYRRAEALEVTSSRMQVEQVELKAASLMGVSYATEELMRFSPRSIAALLAQGFGDEFRSRMVRERIRGTGVGEYLGITVSPATVTQTAESGQDADTILGLNVVKMRSRIWGYENSFWLANQDCYPQLSQVHIAGTNGDVFLFNPAREVDAPDMLLGRPLFYTEHCATIGDAGDLMLINPTQYLEGTLQPLEGSESIHVRFLAHERTFKFVTMNAGAPWWRAALTPVRSSITLSPFVILGART